MNSKFPVEKNRTNNLCDKAIKESIVIKISQKRVSSYVFYK